MPSKRKIKKKLAKLSRNHSLTANNTLRGKDFCGRELKPKQKYGTVTNESCLKYL